jgi:hypothetical protein
MALQPNFVILNNAVGQLFSTELSKFQNLPQVADPQAIMDAIHELRDTMLNKFEAMEARMRARLY